MVRLDLVRPYSGRAISWLKMGLVLGLASAAHAQFQSSNVTLLDIVPGSGNDCWGYVSPSGREYALAGNRDHVKFVDITDPSNAVVVASFPHTSSTWGDIKVYQDHAYAVTERATGIQVFDLSDIDNGNVTLVRTVESSSRSHNVFVDEDSGFLYTLGSRDFSPAGTTTCWDLADPANPVRVGADSMTLNYQHDAQVRTFTSGPNAGKQILYGCAGGNGLEIYDVTDKNNPQLLSTTTYPSLEYCHQGWLSGDSRYFYVDDELDELRLGITTRTLIFDVSDINNPVFVGTFTTGLNSIDHNQYWMDGFLFQANYTSGLRVINACDPENLTEVGFFDSYPANNENSFSGAWSVYPYFPSGTCIINNLGGDLFIVDPSAAVSGGCGGGCPCACDFDPDPACDIFDFLAFQNQFVAGDPCACDFDPDPACDIFDFLAFQNQFVGGCR